MEMLIATSWTSAGQVVPGEGSQVSPIPVQERLKTVAATGWQGMGLSQDDLAVIRDEIGFDKFRLLLDRSGMTHFEVEGLYGWWHDDADRSLWRDTWALLLEAGEATGSAFVKFGTGEFDSRGGDPSALVQPLRERADEAAERGQRIALEALFFSAVPHPAAAADLIRAVGRDNVGICVDLWHLFRSGLAPLEALKGVEAHQIFTVELADGYVVPRSEDPFEDTVQSRTLPGQGEFNAARQIDAIRSLGYTGPWGVEVLSSEFRALPLEEALTQAREAALGLVF